jgi:hypothetical protein
MHHAWIKIQAGDVADLLDEQWIFGKLEGLGTMGSMRKGAPDVV